MKKESVLFQLIGDKWSKIIYVIILSVATIVWYGAGIATDVKANTEFREDLGGADWLKLKFETIENKQDENQKEILRRLEVIEDKI